MCNCHDLHPSWWRSISITVILVQHRAVLSFQCVWLWALHWQCAVAPSSSFLRDTYAATFHSFEFIFVALMEAVQASVSYTKVKISRVQMRHRLSVPIFLQVPSSQGGLCFSDDKEELATFTTLFVSSHTINRYHLPPHSLVGGSPASFPPEILTERQAYI